MRDEFSMAVDELCAEIGALGVEVLDGVDAALAGGPLGDLAAAMCRVARLNVAGRDDHNVARLLLMWAVVDAGRDLGDDQVAEMVGSGDELWRLAGEACALIRDHGPDIFAEPSLYRLG